MLDRAVTKEEVAGKLDQLGPENLAEVDQFIDYLKYRTSHATRASASSSMSDGHPAFGIWADRLDITDTAEYAQKLRQNIEEHVDAKPLN